MGVNTYLVLNLKVEENLVPFVERAKAVIFIGGTMEPRSEYQPLKARAAHTFELSAPHIVPVDHTLARYICVSCDGSLSLDFRSNKRSEEPMLRALHSSLNKLFSILRASRTNGGMVVFFPSFDYLKTFAMKFYAGTLVSDLAQAEKEVCETTKTSGPGASCRTATSSGALGASTIPTPARAAPAPAPALTFAEVQGQPCELLLRVFSNAALRAPTLLFAVVGGKVSEGINFKDDMCRCVCVVGLPYPNPQDPALVEKMKYLDGVIGRARLQEQSTKPFDASLYLSGRDYYQMRCMKAVNQCIGRAIRHKGDWASIFLLDHRYGTSRIMRDISEWLRCRFGGGSFAGGLETELSDFYRARDKTQTA